MAKPLTLEIGVIYVTKIWSDSWSVHKDGKVVMLGLDEKTWLKLTESKNNNGILTFQVMSGVFSGCAAYVHMSKINSKLLEERS